jgi:hypothetical protein
LFYFEDTLSFGVSNPTRQYFPSECYPTTSNRLSKGRISNIPEIAHGIKFKLSGYVEGDAAKKRYNVFTVANSAITTTTVITSTTNGIEAKLKGIVKLNKTFYL